MPNNSPPTIRLPSIPIVASNPRSARRRRPEVVDTGNVALEKHWFRICAGLSRRGGRRKQRGMSFRRLWMWWTTRRGSLHHRVSKRGGLLVRERFRAPVDICYLRLTIRKRQRRLGKVCQGLQFLHISQRGAPCRARRPLAKLWPASPARQPTAKPAGA